MSIISRIIGSVSIILEIIGKKKRNSRKHNRKILEHNRLKPSLRAEGVHISKIPRSHGIYIYNYFIY